MKANNLRVVALLLMSALMTGCLQGSDSETNEEEVIETDPTPEARALTPEEQMQVEDMKYFLTTDTSALESIDIESRLASYADIDKNIVEMLDISGPWEGDIETTYEDSNLAIQPIKGVISTGGISSFYIISRGIPFHAALTNLSSSYTDEPEFLIDAPILGILRVTNLNDQIVAEYSFEGIKTNDEISGRLTNGIEFAESGSVGENFVTDNRYTSLHLKKATSTAQNTPSYLKQKEIELLTSIFGANDSAAGAPVYLLDESGNFSFAYENCLFTGYLAPSSGALQFATTPVSGCPDDTEAQGIIYLESENIIVIDYFFRGRRYIALNNLREQGAE